MENKIILAGIQLSQDGAQVTWYGEGLTEPQTLSLPKERNDGMLEVPHDVWKGALNGRKMGTDILGRYLLMLIGMIPGRPHPSDIRLCITLPRLTQELGDHLCDALEKLGMERKHIYLQDWKTSFFYYVVNKRRELWSGDVAFIGCKQETMTGYILHIDRTVKPGLVTIQETASADVGEKARAGRSDADWDKERDRLLYELLGKLFERRTVSASYLYGTFFDQSWAKRSFQYLTFRRHAFQGQNLFSKGACYSALARNSLITMPELMFLGADCVRENIGMYLRVRGREQYYPLVQAGVNWYEAHSECEFIPDREKTVTVLSTPMEEGRQVGRVLRLDHFPDRDNRATRLRMTLYFTSVNECRIEVEDLGFGGFYPPSGRIWKRSIHFEKH